MYKLNLEKNLFSTVKEGDVVGIVSDQAGMFLGIPFGQPPLGELRWKRPRDPKPFDDKYWNATYLRPGCDQICDQPASDYSCPLEASFCNTVLPLLFGHVRQAFFVSKAG